MLTGKVNKNTVKLSQKLAYGVGHVMNDICASMWFSYTLLFYEVVLEMSSSVSGIVIFIGQVADAVASPIIGILVDRFGTRKSWHMLGTALIAFSFSLIFSNCPWTPGKVNKTDVEKNSTSWDSDFETDALLRTLYYSVLVIIFQAGWATVQIAHLAIIPDMTPDKAARADLTSIRYTATVGSSVFVYLVTWLILHVTEGNTVGIGPKDLYKFKEVVIIGLLTGGTFTMLFHALLDPTSDSEGKAPNEEKTNVKIWLAVIREYFKSWKIYQVTLLYFSSRMLLNVSLIYMPLYLVENVEEKAEYIATVPLVSYLASFLASLGVGKIGSFWDSKTNYLFGALLSIGGCFWIGIGFKYSLELFGVSILLGAGSSITGVASLCLCANLIGTDTKNGAFVYSVVTAVDKLLGGVVVIVIENFKENIVIKSSHYYQNVLAYGCGVSTLLGLITLITMYCYSAYKLKKNDSASAET